METEVAENALYSPCDGLSSAQALSDTSDSVCLCQCERFSLSKTVIQESSVPLQQSFPYSDGFADVC